MQSQALSSNYPWDQFPVTPITECEQVPSGASYASIAVTRLCGPNKGGGCELQLLCTRCGTTPTFTMQRVSRKVDGDADDEVMADKFMFKTPASDSRLLVPANIIVIDAHALLLATQREAMMPGVGLSRPIRPLQGPVCAGCRCLSTERRVSGELKPTSLDDAMTTFGVYSEYDDCLLLASSTHLDSAMTTFGVSDEYDDCLLIGSSKQSSLPTSPRNLATIDRSDFEHRHRALLDCLENLGLHSTAETSCTDFNSKKRKPAIADVSNPLTMYTDCECGSSKESPWAPCVKTYETPLIPHASCSPFADSPLPFAIAFGYTRASPKDAVEIYEICVVDTGKLDLCRLDFDGTVRDGVAGQFIYNNPLSRCDLTGVAIDQPLEPPRDASCFVCSALLSSDSEVDVAVRWSIMNRRVTSTKYKSVTRKHNIYLPSHSNWAHKVCVAPCDKSILGVCTGCCPRLNTAADCQLSPRFETVCQSCAVVTRTVAPPPLKLLKKSLPPVPLFHETPMATTDTSSTAPVKSSSKPPSKVFKKSKSTASHKASGKRPATHGVDKPSWLSEASSVKLKADADAARALNGGVAQEEWVRDLGGVYNNKVDGTWYTLDRNGENNSPVCGQPFSDPYFNCVRTWETLDERSQAILSHQCLLEMADM